MIKLFRRHSVSILNKDWKPIKEGIKVKFIPRYGELIFIEEYRRYYKVLNVVYNLMKNKEGVFVIVEEFGEELPTQNEVS